MSRRFSDPAQNPQFRRNWGDARPGVEFLAALGEHDLDRLAIERGERIVRRLPVTLVAGLELDERRDLARAFGCAACASSAASTRRPRGLSVARINEARAPRVESAPEMATDSEYFQVS